MNKKALCLSLGFSLFILSTSNLAAFATEDNESIQEQTNTIYNQIAAQLSYADKAELVVFLTNPLQYKVTSEKGDVQTLTGAEAVNTFLSRFDKDPTLKHKVSQLVHLRLKAIKNDYLRHIQQEAKAGKATAQNQLGQFYLKGDGVPQSPQQAALWFNKAAQQGEAVAQYNLAMLYAQGVGIVKDDKTALKWLELSAKQGYAIAQTSLGLIYEKGKGQPVDLNKALYYYKLAAKQGDKTAQERLKKLLKNK